MMRKRQTRFASHPNPSLAEQFDILASMTTGWLIYHAPIIKVCDTQPDHRQKNQSHRVKNQSLRQSQSNP
jgi:hypothetical protein